MENTPQNTNNLESTTALPVTEAAAQPIAATPAPHQAVAPAANAERKKTFLHIAIGFVAAAILITPTTWMVASSTAQNAGPGMSQMGGGQMGGPGGQMGQNGQMGGQMGQSSDGTTNGTTDGTEQQGQMPGGSTDNGTTSSDSSTDSSTSNS